MSLPIHNPKVLLTITVANTKEQRHLLERAIEGDLDALTAIRAAFDAVLTPDNLKSLCSNVLGEYSQ